MQKLLFLYSMFSDAEITSLLFSKTHQDSHWPQLSPGPRSGFTMEQTGTETRGTDGESAEQRLGVQQPGN